MKIKAIINIKYEGKLYSTGDEFEVKKEIGEELIKSGHAEVVEVKPKGGGKGGTTSNKK